MGRVGGEGCRQRPTRQFEAVNRSGSARVRDGIIEDGGLEAVPSIKSQERTAMYSSLEGSSSASIRSNPSASPRCASQSFVCGGHR